MRNSLYKPDALSVAQRAVLNHWRHYFGKCRPSWIILICWVWNKLMRKLRNGVCYVTIWAWN